MLATRSFLRNLALTALLGSSMVVPTLSITMSLVTPTPAPTITNEPPRSCYAQFASIMVLRQEPVGELHTAMRSASITPGIVPSIPCSVLAVLPSSLQDDFAEFETRWYNWWQPQRSNFTSWASTCATPYAGNLGIMESEYLNATSSMDNFTPRVTTCADFTGTGTVGTASPGGPTGTGPGGVAETAPAGESGGAALRSQHTAAGCILVATVSGIIAIL